MNGKKKGKLRKKRRSKGKEVRKNCSEEQRKEREGG